ncbi:hypothetical protein QM480_23810 [Flectobacillus sp. DC10W]|uniref:Uncharacterized protein n=1 Tax=Flectobacillus longus TaxID=2984207 RepID=A0ABT6YV13_9BACT|nr:hypothetical protein [Flectobacillus longus]MDI9867390.1 hypothetical protein [Flectobacillus longus]
MEGEVEFDELYFIAGHKGKPSMVKENREARLQRLKGKRGRGITTDDKPPVLGIIQHHCLVIIRMLDNFQ